MANESQFVEVIKQAKESDKDRKFNQSVEMIMVFKDVDTKKGFILHTSEFKDETTIIVNSDIFLTSNVNILKSIVKGNGPI